MGLLLLSEESLTALVTGDAGALALTGAEATTGVTGSTITGTPAALLLTGAEASVFAGSAVQGDAGALVLTGAEGSLVLSENAYIVGAPGALLLSGGTATVTPSGSGGVHRNLTTLFAG